MHQRIINDAGVRVRVGAGGYVSASAGAGGEPGGENSERGSENIQTRRTSSAIPVRCTARFRHTHTMQETYPRLRGRHALVTARENAREDTAWLIAIDFWRNGKRRPVIKFIKKKKISSQINVTLRA